MLTDREIISTLEMLENENESTKIEGVLFNFYRYQYALNNEEFYLDSMDSI